MKAKTNKIYRISFLVVAVALLVIEALPFSVQLNFSNGTEELWQGYSYFSIIPFGFSVFFTFPIAIFTCCMAALGALSLFLSKDILRVSACIFSLLTFIAAILSLIFSYVAVSLIGVGILLLTLGAFILALLCAGQKGK